MPIPSIFVAGEIAKAVVTGGVGWVGGGGIQVAVILGNSTKAALNQAFFTCHASLPLFMYSTPTMTASAHHLCKMVQKSFYNSYQL